MGDSGGHSKRSDQEPPITLYARFGAGKIAAPKADVIGLDWNSLMEE
jgi:hypothetical protein